MTQLICLANSWRDYGRCIAGIDLATGQWVRPIPERGGSIAPDRTLVGGTELRLLDIVEMDLAPPALATKFQRENRVIRDGDWRVVGRAAPSDVIRRCSQLRVILHNRIKVVRPEWLATLPPRRWTSLQLVRADNAEFVKDERKEQRWKVRFSCAGGPEYTLTLTDPVATERLNRGGTLSRCCVLTVSLTEPIAFRQTPPLCYKVAAAVVELSGLPSRGEPGNRSTAASRFPPQRDRRIR